MTHVRCGGPGHRPESTGAQETRREFLEQLQVIEVHLQTAAALEARADRSTDGIFAGALRHRAAQHRRIARRLRDDLVARGRVPCPPPRRP